MSAPVDVRAVMGAAAETLGRMGDIGKSRAVKMEESLAAIEDLRLKADNAERALRNLVAAGQAPAGYLQYADDLAAALRAVGGAK